MSGAALVGPLPWTFQPTVRLAYMLIQRRADGSGEIELPIAVCMRAGEFEKRPCWWMQHV